MADDKKSPQKIIRPMRSIDMVVDTISTNTNAYAYFSPEKRTITVNYQKSKQQTQQTQQAPKSTSNTHKKTQKPEKKVYKHKKVPTQKKAPKPVTNTPISEENIAIEQRNQKAQSFEILLHEQKHRDNYNNGTASLPLGYQNYYKKEMWDEISGHMSTLIYLRDQYIKTGDTSVFENSITSNDFSFYKEAIEKGEINPKSSYKEDFDKDMRLIVNGTKQMWIDNYSSVYDCQQIPFNAIREGKSDTEIKPFDDDNNYKQAQKIELTIGGVDFTKYLDNDVEISELGQSLFDTIKPEQLEKGDNTLSNKELAEKYEYPAYDSSMSLLSYQKLLQHHLLINGVADEIKDIFNSDKSMQDVHDKTKADAKSVYENLLAVTPLYQEKNKIMALVDAAARDHAEERLPKQDDAAQLAAYNNAVNKIYTEALGESLSSINPRQILNSTDELPFENLPDYAKKIDAKNNTQKQDNKPQYPTWTKDGPHVSQVMFIDIPDLQRDFIDKPTKSYADENLKNTLKLQAAQAKGKSQTTADEQNGEMSPEELKQRLKDTATNHGKSTEETIETATENAPAVHTNEAVDSTAQPTGIEKEDVQAEQTLTKADYIQRLRGIETPTHKPTIQCNVNTALLQKSYRGR